MSDPGLLSIILHSHLPFVRHPEQQDFLEERWLFEAITETYLPLLERFHRLAEDQVPYRLAMSLSPPLLTMLSDPLLQDRYLRYLEQLLELSEKEIQRTRWQPPFQRLALLYRHRFSTARRLFVDVYGRNLLRAFRELRDRGYLELLASCATHGFLPLLDGPHGDTHAAAVSGPGLSPGAAAQCSGRAAVRAQIHLGIQTFQEAFGRRPDGFWLPECGYTPGCDKILRTYGIRYFVTDAHGILFGSPRPRDGMFAPVRCPSGVAAFGRDLESSRNIWGVESGYPAHVDYREFYRDIGYDVEYDYIRPYLTGDGMRISTGIKYYRITGRDEEKSPYDPDRALDQAAKHAAHFILRRRRQMYSLRKTMDHPPVIVSPYDAELFGHWWFEGPDWLEFVIRNAHAARRTLRLITPSDYLEEGPAQQVVQPAMSSWGVGGYHEMWLNSSNDWIYRHLHRMAERMVEAATRHPQPDALRRRALNQMARELLLAQSSDWAFILKTQTHTAYAYRRLNEHLARFTHLDQSVTDGEIDASWLAEIEDADCLFPSMDYRIYATDSRGA